MVEELGFTLYRPRIPAVIDRVVAGSAGEAGGLRPGDRVLAIDGQPVREWAEVVSRVRRAAGETLHLDVERGGETLGLRVTPRVEEERGQKVGRLGVQVDSLKVPKVDMFTTVRHGPLAALGRALGETWGKSVFSLQMMGRMLVGDVSWKNLSGPVTIADYAGQSAQLGITYFLQFMALVSISLGVLNLLPVPLLDGGHLMYHLYEAIRGAPPSEQAIDLGQRIGFALLIGLMVFAFYNDITRLISG
jgi:regulator of sigma E protease